MQKDKKREVTICNLFANQRLRIQDIVRVLDERYERVVNILIEHQLIYERRRKYKLVREDRRLLRAGYRQQI